MTTAQNVPDWQAFFDEINRPGPHSQLEAEHVALFSEGDQGGCAWWIKGLDRLVYIPKAETTRTQRLNDFVNLCLAAYAPDTIGFQLECFSHFAPRIWEILSRSVGDRVSFGEILLYYEMLALGRTSSDPEFDFQLNKMRELRDLFGHVTIFQPEHARTIAL